MTYDTFSWLNPIILNKAKGKNNIINILILKVIFGIKKYTKTKTNMAQIILRIIVV